MALFGITGFFVLGKCSVLFIARKTNGNPNHRLCVSAKMRNWKGALFRFPGFPLVYPDKPVMALQDRLAISRTEQDIKTEQDLQMTHQKALREYLTISTICKSKKGAVIEAEKNQDLPEPSIPTKTLVAEYEGKTIEELQQLMKQKYAELDRANTAQRAFSATQQGYELNRSYPLD